MDDLTGLKKKVSESKDIDLAMKKFLAKGGKITKIKMGPVFAPNAFAALLGGGDSGFQTSTTMPATGWGS